MLIYNVVHYIIIGESAGTDSLKRLVLCFKFIIAASEIEASNLYKTFLDFLL